MESIKAFTDLMKNCEQKPKSLLRAIVFITVIKMTSSLSLQKPVADINIIVILARGNECTV